MASNNFNTSTLFETRAGALATPDLVGRGQILAEIDEAIRDINSSTVFYIIGQGGIGKTRLVTHYLTHSPVEVAKPVLAGMVDLYDISTNTIEGLIKRVQETLAAEAKKLGNRAFTTYLKERRTLDRFRMIGKNATDLNKQRNLMIDAFFVDLERLARQQRIVLVLDTAEKLFHRENPVIEALGLEEERPEVLSWLVNDFFPHLPKMVVLLAGRPNLKPEKRPLQDSLEQAFAKLPQINYRFITLQGLTEEEALDYFEAIIRTTEKTDNPRDLRVAEVVQMLTEADRRLAFHCLRDEGHPPHVRPILLALAIDHMVTAGRPLEVFKLSLEEARRLSKEKREEIKRELGIALIKTLRQSAHPADRVLITLGVLRLGADPHLLSKILADEGIEETQETIATAIADVGRLSFVKHRGDRRIILHDEMYDLLQPYDEADYYVLERDRILATMEAIYKEQIEQIRKEIYTLTLPLVEGEADKLDQETLEEIIEARGRLRVAILEDLHYRLRRDAQKGFQVFYRYIEEAVTEADELFGIQLQAEVYGFMAERDPEGQREEIDGLRRAEVIADAAVRQVKWLWSEGDINAALALAKHLSTEKYTLIEVGGDLPLADLISWQGVLEGHRANYTQAKLSLLETISKLEQPSRHTVRSAGILAQAYNQLGYVYRLQGLTHEAIQSYRQALPYWRAAGFRACQANTLNNLAYALALIGDFEPAERYGNDALNLRLELGPRMPTVLSLNTWALIDIRRGQLDRGLRRSQRAYSLSNTLNHARGIGLALTALAEAKRRISANVTQKQQGQTAQLLAEASQHATEAARIFTEQSYEPDHQVRALIEVGCAYRDWALLRCADETMLAPEEKVTGQIQSVENLVTRGEQTFQKAIEAAGEVYDLRADVLLNLALLNYIKAFSFNLADPDEVVASLNRELFPQIEKTVLSHYSQRIILDRLTDLLRLREGDIFSLFLGRLEGLRGRIAFSYFNRSNDQKLEWLREAARHFTLTLAYHGLYSDKDFREMRRAKNRVYESFNKLSTEKMNIVFETVAAVEKEYGLAYSPMSKFLEESFGLREAIVLIDV
jgi:hypothetical protein